MYHADTITTRELYDQRVWMII